MPLTLAARRRRAHRAGGALLLALALPAHAGEGFSFRGEAGLEARGFFHDPVDSRQEETGDVSLRLLPELYGEWNGGNTAFTFSPFGRVDSADDERTHWDVRELYFRHRAGAFEARIGARKVFWGATESTHLVDIINQTDLVENPDTEDKFGQPMVNLAWLGDGQSLEVFALPYFRERRYPGVEGRMRPGVAMPTPPYPPGTTAFVSNDEAAFESKDEEKHVDWATRYAWAGDSLDLGLAHFSGTSRNPRFGPGGVVNTPEGPALVPYYELVERDSLDATLVAGGWLFKLEGFHQRSDIEDYAAAAGGFEYTLNGVFESAVDVGLLAEYIWDERGETAPQPFQNDIFVGTRIAANDEASTELLAGAIVDADTQSVFSNIEASRRIADGWKLALECRLFMRAEPQEPAYVFRNDDYVSLELAYFF